MMLAGAVALALAGLPVGNSPAIPAQGEACRIISQQAASIVQLCDGRYESFSLSFDDPGRRTWGDRHAQFHFSCKTPCPDGLGLMGWFIHRSWWEASPKDESTVFDALMQMPVGALSWGSPGLGSQRLRSRCGVFDVRIEDMSGRAVCAADPAAYPSYPYCNIVVVIADERLAVVLVIAQRGLDCEEMRNDMAAISKRFRIARARDNAAMPAEAQ